MKKIAIVYSNYYPEIATRLIDEFKANFSKTDYIVEFSPFEVFGVSEIPFVVATLSDKFDAVAVFGCVVEGETYHHDLMNRYVFDKLYDLSLKNRFVLGYSILNVKNFEQAVERSQPNTEMNRGYEAFAAIKSVFDLSVV
jgi:6,7-dimethyl-8-ribityllumazine synthase